MPSPCFALFFAIFSQSLCGQRTRAKADRRRPIKVDYRGIFCGTNRAERRDLRCGLCVPDLGHKLRGFAPQLASAFSSHFPAIITLINLLRAGDPKNCNESNFVWGSSWWYGMENYHLDHTHWEQLPVTCVPSRRINPIPIGIISNRQPGKLSFFASTGRQQS